MHRSSPTNGSIAAIGSCCHRLGPPSPATLAFRLTEANSESRTAAVNTVAARREVHDWERGMSFTDFTLNSGTVVVRLGKQCSGCRHAGIGWRGTISVVTQRKGANRRVAGF